MTWPRPKDRIVVHGHVDDVGGTDAWIIVDNATGISETGIPLVLVPTSELVPELTPHVLLKNQWWNGAGRNQVMLIGTIAKEHGDSGLVSVEFTDTFPTSPLRLTIAREKLIFGRTNDA